MDLEHWNLTIVIYLLFDAWYLMLNYKPTSYSETIQCIRFCKVTKCSFTSKGIPQIHIPTDFLVNAVITHHKYQGTEHRIETQAHGISFQIIIPL